MNNKVCPKCRTVNELSSNYCISCGNEFAKDIQPQLNTENVNANMNVTQDDSKATNLGVLSLILYFVGGALITLILSMFPEELRKIFSSLSGLCPLAGIVVMIVGRIKYPKNKMLKIAMWVIIVSIIVSIVLAILFIIWCIAACNDLSEMDWSACF